MFSNGQNTVGQCSRCDHPMSEHQLVTTFDSTIPLTDGQKKLVPGGGYIRCPSQDCECMATWMLPQATPVIPNSLGTDALWENRP